MRRLLLPSPLLLFGTYAPGGAMTGGVVANLSISEW